MSGGTTYTALAGLALRLEVAYPSRIPESVWYSSWWSVVGGNGPDHGTGSNGNFRLGRNRHFNVNVNAERNNS